MQVNYINQFKEKGYSEIKNFINDNEINELKKFVNKNLSQNKFNSFFLSSKSNNNIDKFFIKHKQIEKKLIKILTEISNGLGVVHSKSKKPYYVLIVLHNKRIKQESLNFHFTIIEFRLTICFHLSNSFSLINSHSKIPTLIKFDF